MLKQVRNLIRNQYRASDRERRRYFRPDTRSIEAYEDSLIPYRRDLVEILGWPLTLPSQEEPPSVRMERVARDPLGTIHRVWVETLPGVETYGLYFRPKGKGPFPLVISMHGGGGTPETCSGFFNSANYNDMTRRVLRRGAAVFAPQFLLWESPRFGPDHKKDDIDRDLKQLGGSLAALEIHRLRRSLDYFLKRREIDANRVGMVGLSYGGFYTLYAAAVETRIKVAVPSCGVTNRKIYNWPDMTWTGAAQRVLDIEAGALICPRALYIDASTTDDIFSIHHGRPIARRIGKFYEKLGIAKRYVANEHGDWHALDVKDGWLKFMFKHL
ncbi:MAG: prolyl oligopeptidase family serine peptidase [Verrucomicrobia bacterium]|nr:prolyl oligopeptidase family serine peptidase [Verrucomicrobiota bacterium]